MSRSRQPAGPQVRASSVGFSTRFTWRARNSDWAQLIFTLRGAVTVYTETGVWVVPPHQAVWVPAHVRHHVEVGARVALHTVYVKAPLRRGLPQDCRVVTVSPLLRDVCRRTIQLATLHR